MTEVNTTPDSTLDILSRDVSTLKQEVVRLNGRLAESDKLILKLLTLLKKSEETFDVRVARSLYNVFNGVSHNLEHSIDHYTEQLKQHDRGFNVDVVDGKTVLENDESIVVTKRTDGGYDFAKATEPDVILNEGTEVFANYFNEYPQVFGDRTEIMVNVTTHLQPAKPEDVVHVEA